jgi:SPX domain protein involved in polyphosphate accumulation
LRFERKYRVENFSYAHSMQLIKAHPAAFYQPYPDRIVNNIYFDTPNLQCLQENLAGISTRKKYRVRWYGEALKTIVAPKLEIKYKENLLGAKKGIALESFNINELNELSIKVNELLPLQFALQPVLLNSYYRSYWETRCGKFRITVDTQLNFHSLLHSPYFERYLHQDPSVIIELKYEKEDEETVDRIAALLPFRLTKNSKYVTGMFLTR